jgi:hypothetical protein
MAAIGGAVVISADAHVLGVVNTVGLEGHRLGDVAVRRFERFDESDKLVAGVGVFLLVGLSVVEDGDGRQKLVIVIFPYRPLLAASDLEPVRLAAVEKRRHVKTGVEFLAASGGDLEPSQRKIAGGAVAVGLLVGDRNVNGLSVFVSEFDRGMGIGGRRHHKDRCGRAGNPEIAQGGHVAPQSDDRPKLTCLAFFGFVDFDKRCLLKLELGMRRWIASRGQPVGGGERSDSHGAS